MNLFSLALYEIKVRFQTCLAWKIIVTAVAAVTVWLLWNAAFIAFEAYLVAATFLSPDTN